MKKKFLLVLAIGLFTSCSKNDPTEDQQDKSCKVISYSFLSDETNQGFYDEAITSFTYDSKNRFSKVEKKKGTSREIGRFIYEDNTIKYQDSYTDATYTLNSKNLIVRSDYKYLMNGEKGAYEYSYNTSNQLQSIIYISSNSNEENDMQLTYENGNLVKVVENNYDKIFNQRYSKTLNFTFTNDKAPLYNSEYLKLFGTDQNENLLYSQGYFGVPSKNMVRSVKTSASGSDIVETYYLESTVDNQGNVTEIVPNKSDIYKYNYQCE